MTQRIEPKTLRCLRCGSLHTLTRVKGMILAMLSCPTCGSDFDAKKKSEMMKQIESIVNAKPSKSAG